MYPLHFDARANDPRVSLRALGSPHLTCPILHSSFENAKMRTPDDQDDQDDLS
jgi:hypothetical protein